MLLIPMKAYFLNQRKRYRLKKGRYDLNTGTMGSADSGQVPLVLREGEWLKGEGESIFPGKILGPLAGWGCFVLQILDLKGQACSEVTNRPRVAVYPTDLWGGAPAEPAEQGGCLREPGLAHPADLAVFRVHLASSIPGHE